MVKQNLIRLLLHYQETKGSVLHASTHRTDKPAGCRVWGLSSPSYSYLSTIQDSPTHNDTKKSERRVIGDSQLGWSKNRSQELFSPVYLTNFPPLTSLKWLVTSTEGSLTPRPHPSTSTPSIRRGLQTGKKRLEETCKSVGKGGDDTAGRHETVRGGETRRQGEP